MRMRDIVPVAIALLALGCETPDPEGAQRDVSGPATPKPGSAEPDAQERSGEPPKATGEPRDAPAKRWTVETYDERLVWMNESAVTELVFEFTSGVALSTPVEDGLRIDGLGRGSVAAEIGLRPGDVLKSLDGQATTPAAMHDAWARSRHSGFLDLVRVRGSEETSIRLWLRSASPGPTPARVAAAVVHLGVKVLDESRRVVDRDLLEVLHGRESLAVHDELWSSLGISPRAEVVRVEADNVDPPKREAALAAIVEQREAKAFEVLVVEGSDERRLQYEVGSGIAPASVLDRIREHKQRPLLNSPWRSGVEGEGDFRVRLEKSVLDELVSNPSAFAKTARVVPSQKDGEVVGFKLYGIRRDTLLDQLGFQNGDMITSVQGLATNSIENVMTVMKQLGDKEPSTIRVGVVRRGKDIEIEIEME